MTLKTCTCNYSSEHVHTYDLVRQPTTFQEPLLPGIVNRMEEIRQQREDLEIVASELEDEWFELDTIRKEIA